MEIELKENASLNPEVKAVSMRREKIDRLASVLLIEM